jgi:hypothetical protein
MMAIKRIIPPKLLIVTSCTKDKVLPVQVSNHSLVQALQLWDDRDDDRALRDFGELEQYRVPATQLYHGLQHTELMRGVELLRRTFGQSVVDVKIISAGFGVVDEDQPLPPYEATFADQSKETVRALSRRLRIPQTINALVSGAYDCAFFLLGENYLLSLELPWNFDPLFPCLFLASPSVRTIPRRHPYALIPAGKDEGSAFHYGLVGLKGHLFKLFAEQLVSPWTKNQAFQSCTTASARLESFLSTPTPQFFLRSIRPVQESRRVVPAPDSLVVQQSLFPDVCIKAKGKRASNYGRPVRYYVPDWDDLVDPGYDFERDLPTEARKRHVDEVYAHQIYAGASYDGLLFSKCTVEGGKAKNERIREQGIHTYARFEKPIMGDCGAFSYVTSETPPYETKAILDYYQDLGFDYGVSIDHLIIPAFYPVKEYRYRLTRENAHEFIKLHRAGNYTFVAVGVAQGWSPQTYRDAVVELLEWGYKYVALGGIARTQTRDIYEILEAVAPVLQADVDLHLLGVVRDREGNEMQRFRELGATSFDSAANLRRAWLSDTANYITPDGGRYTAIRISPVHPSHPRVKKLLADGVATLEELQKVEQDALKALRAYGRGQLGLEETLDLIALVDRANHTDSDERLMLYRRTLEEQPWKKCGCEICRHLGIEVLLFRGNDRNRRRGFHNTLIFYQRFQQLMERQA